MVKVNTVNKIKKKKQQVVKENFVHETRLELRKVTWPSKETIIKASLLILIIVVFSTLYIMLADILFANFFEMLRKN